MIPITVQYVIKCKVLHLFTSENVLVHKRAVPADSLPSQTYGPVRKRRNKPENSVAKKKHHKDKAKDKKSATEKNTSLKKDKKHKKKKKPTDPDSDDKEIDAAADSLSE